MKRIALLLFGVFISFANFSQNLTTTEITSVAEIEVCQTESFSVNITKVSGNYSVLDTIVVDLNLPNSIHFVNAGLSGSGSMSIDNGNPENPICTISGVVGNSIEFSYSVRATCDLINASASSALTNNLDISLNGNADHTASSTSYNVLSPWIVFDNSGSSNHNYNLGKFNVLIERTYNFINTSSTEFTGDFMFVDTITTDFSNSGIQFQDIELLYPLSGVDIFKTVTDSSIHYKISISNLSQGDSLVFKETIYLIECPNGAIDNSVANFSASYGCAGGELCQPIQDPSYITTASFDPNDKPIIQVELLTKGYNTCWTDPQERLVKITNTGTGDASEVRLRFLGGFQNSITTIDLSSIEFFKKPAAVEIPVNYVTIDDFGPNQSLFFDSAYASNEVLAAGDSIFIRYYEVINCIDTSEYDTYFNEGVPMHREYPLFHLEHPCSQSSAIYPGNTYGWRQWEHIFSLQQNFENLNGTILDNEELWYEIDNSTTLFLGKEYLGNKFFYNVDSSEIQIKLTVEPGLGLVGDSIYMCSPQGSSVVTLFPYQVDYLQGDGNNTGTGDTAIAHFRIPNNFYADYPPNFVNGDLHYPTIDFNKFFNKFKVKFKLKAYCQYTTGERVSVAEEFFFIPNTECPVDCKLPLSRVSDKIAVHCPGCIVPGWNLSSFNIERTNLDFADSDNNNYPDSYPFELTQADPNLAETQHVMLGDTIKCTINAFTSDGEQLLFNTIGFDYDEGQFVMKGAFLQHLEFIGATGSYTNANGTQSFTIPSASGVFCPNGFTIDLGMDALVNNYGIPPGFVQRFWGGDQITIVPEFIVKDNLINGTGGDPYYSIEQMDASINMSGTPYSGIDIKPDSKGTHIDSIIAMDPISRSEMNYWCTGYDGRIVGIGTNFHYEQTIINRYQLNPCFQTINANMYTDVGQPYIGGYSEQGGTQTAWNSFSYELRNLWTLDSTTINFPDYFEIEKIEFKLTQLRADTINNLTQFNGIRYTSNSTHTYDLNDASYGDSSITIYPARNFQEITSSLYNEQGRFTGYDETKRYRMYAVLKMKDCQTTPDIVPVGNGYPVVSYWSDFPGAQNGDTMITYNMGTNSVFDMPSTEILTQILPLNQNAANADLSWDMNLSSATKTNPYTYGVTNERAENSFVYFVSPSGNINVDEVLWRSNNTNVPIVDTLNGLPLFGLGAIGANWGNWIDAEIAVNANFNCANLNGTDSLLVITGWNCYGYPIAIDAACYSDTSVMYITPELPGIQAQLEVQDIVNACDTLNYNLELKATGLGNVENVNIRLNLPAGGELSYLSGSGMVSFDGNSTSIEPSMDSLGLYWNLDSISFMTNNFNGLSPEAFLKFDIKSSCGFNDEQIELEISANNYCGKLIGPLNLERNPSIIEGLPTLDSLGLSITTSTMEPCNDSTLITLTLVNVGTKATGAFNTLEVLLPNDFAYLSGDTYTTINGNMLSYSLSDNIPIGGTQTISFYCVNTAPVNCDIYPVSGNILVGDEYYCDTVLCFLEGGQNSVVSATANILVEDTIPPTIIGVPNDLVISCDVVLETPTVTVSDNCNANLEYIEFTEDGNCPGNYSITKTWTATDDCGNASTATQIITVEDTEPPIIDCPGNLYLNAGDSIATWNLSATDNCGLDQLYSSIASGSTFPVGTTQVEITAIDACGNSSTCLFEVTRVPPLTVDAGPCQTVYYGYTPLACADLTASLITSSSGPYTYSWSNGETGSTITVCPTVTTVYTVTVTDTNGFSSTADVVVNVIDVSCGNNGKKVLVCHVPPGNPNNVQEICIAQQAVGAHINPAYGHSGCHVGPCDLIDPCDPLKSKTRTTEDDSHVHKEQVTSIYPNPTENDFINIQLADYGENGATATVYNMEGQVLLSTKVNSNSLNKVELGQLASGTYSIRFISDSKIETIRFVKN